MKFEGEIPLQQGEIILTNYEMMSEMSLRLGRYYSAQP